MTGKSMAGYPMRVQRVRGKAMKIRCMTESVRDTMTSKSVDAVKRRLVRYFFLVHGLTNQNCAKAPKRRAELPRAPPTFLFDCFWPVRVARSRNQSSILISAIVAPQHHQ